MNQVSRKQYEQLYVCADPVHRFDQLFGDAKPGPPARCVRRAPSMQESW
jgi:hypothetical protein